METGGKGGRGLKKVGREEFVEEVWVENTPDKNMQAVGRIGAVSIGGSNYTAANKTDLSFSAAKSHRSSTSLARNMRTFKKTRVA